jgi:uncharacterized protein YbjQ (UPF0145 family)
MTTATLDLPQHAIERLEGMRKQGSHTGVFTSDLSVNEFLCVKEAGFEPLGLVMGSSVYHIGLQTRRWSKSEEMVVLTQAMYHARELAIARMEEEAIALGADGVVGVRLIINRHEWGEDNAEFVAIGTAIAARDRSVDYRTKAGKPFTSDLSGQDFWTLLQSGYRPVSLAMGSCVYHVAHQSMMKTLGRTGRNVELTNFTQALYDARELAMERMQIEASKEEAEGIVGVRIEEGSHGWGSHIIEYFAIGTSVTPIPGVTVDSIEKPAMVLSLNDNAGV